MFSMGTISRDSCSHMPLEPPLAPVSHPYVELTVRSNFSFLQGASPPEELIQRAKELGYDAIALTDRDGLYGTVRAMEEADKQGVRLIVGCELTFVHQAPVQPAPVVSEGELPCEPAREPRYSTLTVLVENHDG